MDAAFQSEPPGSARRKAKNALSPAGASTQSACVFGTRPNTIQHVVSAATAQELWHVAAPVAVHTQKGERS